MNIECSEKIYAKEKNMALFTQCEVWFVNLRGFSQNALVDLLVLTGCLFWLGRVSIALLRRSQNLQTFKMESFAIIVNWPRLSL